MRKRIFGGMVLTSAVVLIAAFVIITGFLYQFFSGVERQRIKDGLDLAAGGVEQNGRAYLEDLKPDRYRLTWIDRDGVVLFDTSENAEDMENHAEREEVREAFATGQGESSRFSSTVLEQQMYFARRLTDGTVLRISVNVATVGHIVLGMIQPFLIVLVVALLLSFFLANNVSKRVITPLNNLDLNHPLDNEDCDDIAPLLGRLNQRRLENDAHMRNLRRQADEFHQITASMREGLVLMDMNGTILSINPAAQHLFGTSEDCIGDDFLTIERDLETTELVREAIASGHSEIRSARDGKIYQFDASRIDSDDEPIGVVLLAFDITETELMERHRREFSANVSHELKTPLQGIIGSAELIERGMVRPEDMPRFVGHIRDEAQHMVELIGDVIRLSQLEEGSAMPTEPVDLMSVAKEVLRDHEKMANEQGVTMSLDGESVRMTGVRLLLYEAISNLVDNAIKYNVENGSVRVGVSRIENKAFVTVTDTGKGIPKEHLSRIFERFYRVDHSHSKASGGTGLGLSIVKHAVQYHNGKIDIDSEPDRGTKLTLIFPLSDN